MAAATDSVSSPPMATRPSTPLPRSRLMTCSTPPFSLRGLVRDVPRMVPPSGRMPRTDAGVRSSMSPAPSTPAQPFLMPVTWNPCWNARRATPRIAALSPGASPPPVRTPIRTTPSVVRLPRLAAARGEIEHEHEGAKGNDEGPQNHARSVVELIAANSDDAFEEGGAQEEQDERDADQACPGADVAGATGRQSIQHHAEADRAWDDERPRVGPTLVVVGGVLDQEDQARHRDDAPEDGEALANGAPRGECHEEDQDAGGVEQVISLLRGSGVDGLVAIGGDDTLSVAAAMSDAGYPVVGVPKTIDNDLSVTEFCIGFDTAVGVVVEALDRLHTTASAHHRVMVVEVMGRDTGWVAMVGGLAGGADMIIIPEFPAELEAVVAHLHHRRGEGKDFSIIVVAEGVKMRALEPAIAVAAAAEKRDAFGHVQLAKQGVGDALSSRIEAATGFETRVTVLGHLQRGGSPSPVDRIWATRLGVAATDLLADRKAGVIPIRQDGQIAVVPLRDVIAETQRVPRELYDLQQGFG